MADADPVAAALVPLLQQLDARRIPYALGGALALAFWAEPRATKDIDINVFVPESDLLIVTEALRAAGCRFPREDPAARVRDRGDLVVHAGVVRVDVFFPFHPYHDDVRSRVRTVHTPAGDRPILSAEDLVLFKVLFNRPKDWVDIHAVLLAQEKRLDRAYLRHWLAELIGSNDPRAVKLEDAFRAADPPSP